MPERLGDGVAFYTVVVGAFVATGHGLRSIWRTGRRIEQIHQVVEKELLPNDGNSLKDRVGRIDRRVDTIESQLGLQRAVSYQDEGQ